MREAVPLASIQDAILEFMTGRDDCVLFGAQAVNAYVDTIRATQAVDLAALKGASLAEALSVHLADRFGIAVRVRSIRAGLGYRLFQVRKEGNRHLADVRPVSALPAARRIQGVLVMVPDELIAGKLLASVARAGREKGYSDQRDLAILLRTFPALKRTDGAVSERLRALGAGEAALAAWADWVSRPVLAEPDEAEFAW